MKQAFLVIAHNNPEILRYQLELLDSVDTAFYIHIDKHADMDKKKLRNAVKRSYIEFIPSKKIRWGQYSQIDCELRLLQAAIRRGGYDYYHLISGVDMPLHTVDEMDSMLSVAPNREYIHFDSQQTDDSVKDRVRFYHLFPGRKNWQKRIDGAFVELQRFLHIGRWKHVDLVIQKGANWFSITDSLAKSIIADWQKIHKYFAWSYCGDEVFLQTYVYNSAYREHLASQCFDNDYMMCLRKIDWERGNPYVFRIEDYPELNSSKCLFARKFDWGVDSEIIQKLYKMLKNRNGAGCERL